MTKKQEKAVMGELKKLREEVSRLRSNLVAPIIVMPSAPRDVPPIPATPNTPWPQQYPWYCDPNLPAYGVTCVGINPSSGYGPTLS